MIQRHWNTNTINKLSNVKASETTTGKGKNFLPKKTFKRKKKPKAKRNIVPTEDDVIDENIAYPTRRRLTDISTKKKWQDLQ